MKVCRELIDTEEDKAEGAQVEASGSTCEWLRVFFERFILHLWLIHVDVWHRPTQYFKAIILQLKTNI